MPPETWLRPAALDALVEVVRVDEAAAPLSFATSVREVPRRRSQVRMDPPVVAGAGLRRGDVEPAAVRRLRRRPRGRRWCLGRAGRTGVLRAVPDLLPDAVMARTTKATFGEAYMGAHTQAFVAEWDGNGLDDDLVDTAELRRLWRAGSAPALTAAALQAAWLGSQ